MNVLDTTVEFFQEWDSHSPFTLENLESYYAKFPDMFETYFKSHCKRTPERLNEAIHRYPPILNTMRRTAERLPSVLEDVYAQMSSILDFQMPLHAHIFVGGFGSNAYVTHDGGLYFSAELMPHDLTQLRVLVTHEMAHAFHFEMLRNNGFPFSKLAWDGFTSLYLEGLATFLSKVLNPDLQEGVYFAFDDTAENWIAFCHDNAERLKTEFGAELEHWTMDEEREWFRIRGAKKHDFDRLGYFVGTKFAEFCVGKFGIRNAFTLWANSDIKTTINEWLQAT